ncbi:MAG: hypothetical protein QXM06_04335 [Archaeoglobaceae archaeon]
MGEASRIMNLRLLAEQLGLKRVYKEDCELCIIGYTGKKCPYLKKIGKEFFCTKNAAKIDERLRF